MMISPLFSIDGFALVYDCCSDWQFHIAQG